MFNKNLVYRVSRIMLIIAVAVILVLFMNFSLSAQGCSCEVIPGDEPLPPAPMQENIQAAWLPSLIAAEIFTGTDPVSTTNSGTVFSGGGETLVFVLIDANLDNVADPFTENDGPGLDILVSLAPISDTATITSSVVLTSDGGGQVTMPKHDGWYFIQSLDNHTSSGWDIITQSSPGGSVRILYIAYQKPYVLMPIVLSTAVTSGEEPLD